MGESHGHGLKYRSSHGPLVGMYSCCESASGIQEMRGMLITLYVSARDMHASPCRLIVTKRVRSHANVALPQCLWQHCRWGKLLAGRKAVRGELIKAHVGRWKQGQQLLPHRRSVFGAYASINPLPSEGCHRAVWPEA